MVQLTSITTALVAALMLGETVAHPGMSITQMNKEIAERSAYLRTTKRDLSHCAAKMKERGLEARGIERRSAAIQRLREEVALKKRSLQAKRDEAYNRGNSHDNSNSNGNGNNNNNNNKDNHGNDKKSTSCKSSTDKHASTDTKHSSSTLKTSSKASSAGASAVAASASSKSSSVVASAVATSIKSSTTAAAVVSSTHSTTSTTVAAATAASAAASSAASVASAESAASSAAGTTAVAAGAAPTGAAPTGAMPSGGMGGDNSTSTNSTGGAGQLASSISTFGTAVAAESHEFTNFTGITPTTTGVETTLFGNHSCILNPEGEVGPFYVTGEYVRNDIAETQDGVSVVVDGQFIDITTCEPITDLYWDLWHANSTGVYGGVIGNGNGNSADTSNLNNTFLRGLQPTDSDGVAQFTSIFPGHYAGRATHMHVVTHIGGTVLANETYVGGDVTHIGQLFFDQSLITEINSNYSPYTTNTIAIVDNADDRVFAEETLTNSDPVMDWVMLGDEVSDGLFMWITMGIDSTASYSASAAAAYGADGGVLE